MCFGLFFVFCVAITTTYCIPTDDGGLIFAGGQGGFDSNVGGSDDGGLTFAGGTGGFQSNVGGRRLWGNRDGGHVEDYPNHSEDSGYNMGITVRSETDKIIYCVGCTIHNNIGNGLYNRNEVHLARYKKSIPARPVRPTRPPPIRQG
ncbi:uncharacterized protein LOC112057223 [Bicyclus anynana]|uniref:Uncharacterized protein LOC112057223 n=1 Tax=Bicyclus anynana TaxID=110368 RepID=A0A6J1P6R4_BICAN|nr:uncharacterized protein LOC112057223 [Bicyclus anynana]